MGFDSVYRLLSGLEINKEAYYNRGVIRDDILALTDIYISTIPAELKLGKIKIQAATQTIERAFVEVEN